MGVVVHVQSLVYYASCCICDSDESVLKTLSTNAAQPIFSARKEAIGWEEAYMISCSLNINIHVAICHQLNLELDKFFYSQLWKPAAAKEVSLQYLKSCRSKQRSYIRACIHACSHRLSVTIYTIYGASPGAIIA